MYKLFLMFKYLRERRIAYAAIGAVTLCVALVVVQRSVMGGWLERVKQNARGLLGDIIIDNRSYSGFPLYQEFIDEVKTWPEVEKAAPILYAKGLLRVTTENTEQTSAVEVVGLRLADVYGLNAFKDGLFYEKFYPGSTTLAEQRQPVLGVDPDRPPLISRDGETGYPFDQLPPELERALDQTRRRILAETGKPLTDDGTVETRLNDLLREANLPIVPGYYARSHGPDLAPGYEGNPLPGLILGRDLVARRASDGRYERQYPRGTVATLTLWAVSVRGQVDPIPIKQSFRYADDSRSGVYEIDSKHVYADFDLLQRLVQMDAAQRVDDEGNVLRGADGQPLMSPARCFQIQMKLRPGVSREALPDLCERLAKAYHKLGGDARFQLDPSERRLVQRIEAYTWEESQARIIGPVEKEKMLVTILFGIISLVAVVLIVCILYMIVLQKTRDIGIVKSLGGSSAGVGLIFVIYGAAVGVLGSLLGTVFGVLFVQNINRVQDTLIAIDPRLRVWDMQVYSFDEIPSRVDPVDASVIVLIGVAAAALGSLAAAWRAGSMQPVEALRYE